MKKPSKKLLNKWYAKLRKDGFEDIEDVNSPREYLKRWDGSWFQSFYTPEQFQARRAYYERAEEVLQPFAFKFEKAQHRTIWELHAAGVSNRKIAKKLKKSAHAINEIVAHYKKLVFK